MNQYSIDADLTTVWVHRDGECVARFGKVAYEIYDLSEPRRMVAHGRSDAVSNWIVFTEAVLDLHGVSITKAKTPHRFREELGLKPGYDSDEPLFLIPVDRLVDHGTPFEYDIWGRDVVTRDKVKACIESGHMEPNFVPMGVRQFVNPDWDSRRIAFLVENPDESPISIEVVNQEGRFEIDDGWHRLAAAVYRGDAEIAVALGGCIEGWNTAFPERVEISAARSPAFV